MTTPDPDDRQPSADRDELVSAFLDGETSPAEAARVEADPVLQARLAALRVAAEAVAQPVPPAPAEAKEASIARALAEADQTLPQAIPTDDAGAEDSEAIDELAAARRRREQHSRWLRTASIAAAIVLVVAAIPLLARLGDEGSGEDVAARTSEESAPSSTLDAAGGAAGDDSGEGAEPFSDNGDATALVDLGSIDSEQELAERAAALLAGDVDSPASEEDDAGGDDGSSESAGGGESDGGPEPTAGNRAFTGACAAQLGVPLEAQAIATYRGQDVAILVADSPTGPVAIVVDFECIVVARTAVESR